MIQIHASGLGLDTRTQIEQNCTKRKLYSTSIGINEIVRYFISSFPYKFYCEYPCLECWTIPYK